MIVRRRRACGTTEGARKVVEGMVGTPDVKTASRSTYAAGATGILGIPVWFVLLGRDPATR